MQWYDVFDLFHLHSISIYGSRIFRISKIPLFLIKHIFPNNIPIGETSVSLNKFSYTIENTLKLAKHKGRDFSNVDSFGISRGLYTPPIDWGFIFFFF